MIRRGCSSCGLPGPAYELANAGCTSGERAEMHAPGCVSNERTPIDERIDFAMKINSSEHALALLHCVPSATTYCLKLLPPLSFLLHHMALLQPQAAAGQKSKAAHRQRATGVSLLLCDESVKPCLRSRASCHTNLLSVPSLQFTQPAVASKSPPAPCNSLRTGPELKGNLRMAGAQGHTWPAAYGAHYGAKHEEAYWQVR